MSQLLLWPQPLTEIEERNPTVAELTLVQIEKKAELKAAIGRKRPIEGNNADSDPNRATQSLEQVLSRTTDFGINFLKTQVNKKRDLNEPCGVTMHDYGPENYCVNGISFVKSVSSKSLEKGKPFKSSRSLVEAIPAIINIKPKWANVR
jgi:hypothetical protein